MQKRFLFLMVIIFTPNLWASNVITYTATTKLPETTVQSSAGLHTNAFNMPITNHSFASGQGTITFAGEVTSIGKEAFYQCKTMTSITLPNSVTSIGAVAFAGCSSLSSITIPNKVTNIGEQAFYYCTALTSVTMSNSITTISNSAFFNCTSMDSISIPSSVISIGGHAFSWCTSLSSISVDPANTHYTSVNGVLFNYAKDTLIQYPVKNSRITYTIPSSVTRIEPEAFYKGYSLTSVNIPNRVTSIGESAFAECTSLTSIIIPENVISIANWAFYNCNSITFISSYATTPPTCGGEECFYNIDKSIPLYVPAESVNAYSTAYNWYDFTNIQMIRLNYTAEVLVAHPTQGVVYGGGTYKKDSSIVIAASAFAGYQFDNWSDGNQEEARLINLTSDTTLIAYFTPYKADTVIIHDTTLIEVHDTTFVEVHDTTYINMIEVYSMNPAMGSAVLQAYAIPEKGYSFMCWSDYDTSNPRIVETSDQPQIFTAVFTPETPTSVRETAEDPSSFTKIIRDGQLYILLDGKTYNAQGGEVR